MRKSSRVARRSGDRTLQDDEEEKLNSASKSPAESPLIKQLKMDLVGESVTPFRFSRRKELVEVAGKTGNKLLDQLKVDMVVDSVLHTRGKRRAKNYLDQKSAKKTKVAPVDQIPARQKGFAAKVFRRVQSGDITKPEGHNQLLGRIPGLTHMRYGKEYNRWVRENPEEKRVEPEEEKRVEPDEENKVDPDEENNHGTEEKEEQDFSGIPRMMSIKRVDVLASKKDLGMKDEGGNVEKLKSMKDTLVEILSAGDLKRRSCSKKSES